MSPNAGENELFKFICKSHKEWEMPLLDIDLLRVRYGMYRPNGFTTQRKFMGLANAY